MKILGSIGLSIDAAVAAAYLARKPGIVCTTEKPRAKVPERSYEIRDVCNSTGTMVIGFEKPRATKFAHGWNKDR